MMLGGANLLLKRASRLQARPRGGDVLDENACWPVRWTRKGFSVWAGRDGFPAARICERKSSPGWGWLLPESCGIGFGEVGGKIPSMGIAVEHSGAMGEKFTVDGVEAHILAPDDLKRGEDRFLQDYKDAHGGSDEGFDGRQWNATWCGNNPGEDFLVPPGTKAPDPTSEGQHCYRIAFRCLRLLLVQNAKWKDEGCFDFGSASVRWLGHKRENAGQTALRIGEVDGRGAYSNGVRPLYYPPGIGTNCAQAATGLLPITDTGDVLDADSCEDGVIAYRHTVFRRHGKTVVKKTVNRVWKALPGGGEESEKVLHELESQEDIGRRHFDTDRTDPLALPFPRGTAFDLVLACKTWYWYRKTGVAKGNRLVWKHSGKGYFNTQVAGDVFQLVPARPA